uniref:Uncharacterized protein n=1 Tax=Quercus lobata TaxID=97700 RepID=A0A7N2L667_QUELO
MAFSTLAKHVMLNLMFNVVCSQTSLSTKVISTNFSSPSQAMNRVVAVVVLKFTLYSVVPLVNLHLTLNVLHYHKPQGTNNTSTPSILVIQLKMILVNITIISVKKKETQTIGSTTVQIALIPHIPNIFSGNIQIGSNETLKYLIVTDNPFLSLRKLKVTLHVTNVVFLAKS